MSTANPRDEARQPSAPPVARVAVDPRLRLLHIAWLAILVGVGLELLLLAVASARGEAFDGVKTAASALRSVSWSSLVCVAIGWAQGVQPLSAARNALTGFIAAPLAVIAARAVHKEALVLLSNPAPGANVFEPVFPLVLRAIEYLIFGWWFARVSARSLSARAHVQVGATLGAAATLAQFAQRWVSGGAAPALGPFVPVALNELVFPIGCALVLYGSSLKSRRPPAPAPGH